MYTIAIDDPRIYLDGEAFAKENHSSLKEMVNKYVASLAAKVRPLKSQNEAITETKEFQVAMVLMDSFVADDLVGRIPMEEDGKDAMGRIKY